MITFLSGGTGTPKLIRGFRTSYADHEMAVIVNTAEDMWFSGSHLSPDIDTVMYLFADMLDIKRWWGIEDDTTYTSDFLKKIGFPEKVTLGDRDRAVNIARAELLRGGHTLTHATQTLCVRLGVDATVLPMCDTEVTTCIRSGDEILHFQEYWVGRKGNVEISEIMRTCEVPPVATDEVLTAIRDAEAVIIGPSNPVTSISPILECEGVVDALRNQTVVVVSPFIGDAPVSGPAAALMEAWGMPPATASTFDLYREFADIYIQDIRDPDALPYAIQLDTLMTGLEAAEALAEEILGLL
ncbi:2-phospho-L-lactate transferase [Methanomicrobiaceae archaeon CYW5]|uniref:2-phospho-L-lactate transferase n=1 Tax=Methanovulcanius yangii TaxID=1789227 RepID=UPI0029CA41DF|nr:2-phospho-L-lactate transferase [Methanovulcanius yangii]MBT8507104.1 2-phospho-L-lactate transferase [Methanovulcanius yangii]